MVLVRVVRVPAFPRAEVELEPLAVARRDHALQILPAKSNGLLADAAFLPERSRPGHICHPRILPHPAGICSRRATSRARIRTRGSTFRKRIFGGSSPKSRM